MSNRKRLFIDILEVKSNETLNEKINEDIFQNRPAKRAKTNGTTYSPYWCLSQQTRTSHKMLLLRHIFISAIKQNKSIHEVTEHILHGFQFNIIILDSNLFTNRVMRTYRLLVDKPSVTLYGMKKELAKCNRSLIKPPRIKMDDYVSLFHLIHLPLVSLIFNTLKRRVNEKHGLNMKWESEFAVMVIEYVVDDEDMWQYVFHNLLRNFFYRKNFSVFNKRVFIAFMTLVDISPNAGLYWTGFSKQYYDDGDIGRPIKILSNFKTYGENKDEDKMYFNERYDILSKICGYNQTLN